LGQLNAPLLEMVKGAEVFGILLLKTIKTIEMIEMIAMTVINPTIVMIAMVKAVMLNEAATAMTKKTVMAALPPETKMINVTIDPAIAQLIDLLTSLWVDLSIAV